MVNKKSGSDKKFIKSSEKNIKKPEKESECISLITDDSKKELPRMAVDSVEIQSTDNAPEKDMDRFFSSINKKMGVDVVKRGDDKCFEIKRISSGIQTLDVALGGGYPAGKHIQIKGSEHVGKSWMCFKAIAQLHKDDLTAYAVYINVENVVDKVWAKNIGVDLNRLRIVEGKLTSEDFWEILSKCLSNSRIKIIVLDSLAVMIPRKEAEEDKTGSMKAFTTQSVGTQSSANTQAMRAVNYSTNQDSATIFYINQIRYKIGGYGNPETTPGGQAIKHQLSVDIMVRKGDFYPNKADKENAQGHYINAVVTKNKTYKEQQTASFVMMRDGSLNEAVSIMSLAKQVNYFETSGIKKGNTYTINGEKVATNYEDFGKYLLKNNDVLMKIYKDVEEIISKKGVENEVGLDNDILDGIEFEEI